MNKKTIIVLTAIFIIIIIFNNVYTKNPDKEGYEGDLVPIQKEIQNIAGYERATQLILKNWSKIYHEINHPNKKNRGSLMIKYSIIDSLRQIQKERLKLRFISGESLYNMLIEGKDTTIIFEPYSAADYYMRSNTKDEEAGYTLFKHNIIYTTKPLQTFKIEDNDDDTPSAVIKIKDRYYYRINSYLEY
ncbi:hypothetical protein [Flavobacterium panacagri]|uniref:hypothetical protein n=1 Tax=Flavobacterium panacagri TaxID=3034146 RepID=UPI0025A57A8E|nr:hypothetical protein [Flavobacterium panacagri]